MAFRQVEREGEDGSERGEKRERQESCLHEPRIACETLGDQRVLQGNF